MFQYHKKNSTKSIRTNLFFQLKKNHQENLTHELARFKHRNQSEKNICCLNKSN